MKLPAFYPILDTNIAMRSGVEPVHAARQILDAGAQILQFRHKEFLSREAFGWLEQIAEITRAAGAMLVVNDRGDLAKLFSAALHLGQEDLLPSVARRVVGPDTMVGFSTHNESQLRAANEEQADYLALGPLFGNVTKETIFAGCVHSLRALWWRSAGSPAPMPCTRSTLEPIPWR